MARLTWAKKLNNRLKRNWGVEIDFSKCFRAAACGKRNYYDHGNENPISDERWHRIYDLMLPVTKKDSVSIDHRIHYDWNEDYEQAYRNESEYYGICNGYVIIDVTTPTGRKKIQIDSRYA